MEDVSALLLGPAGLTREDLEAAVPELPHELHLRLWQAMGFAQVDTGIPAFTEADLQAVRDAAALRASLVGDDDVLVALARSMAQALGRVAESHVRLFAATAPGDDEAKAEAVRTATATMARLLDYVWRRHLAAATLSLADTAAETPAGVAFVDLVGYTAFARRTDAAALERTLERFEDRVQTAAAQHSVRVVKSLGDAVLLTAADVGGLARAVLTVLDHEDEDQPQAHAGLALGPLLPRNGDVYGEAVNIASRLTGIARPGTLLADDLAARQLAEVGGLAVKAAGVRSVRGYAHLKTWRVRAADDAGEGGAQPTASASAKTA